MNLEKRQKVRPVILAGGLGTRLRPRTNHLPKPMLPVDGRPILWYVLKLLERNDIKAPIVSLDYKSDIIRAFFDQKNISFCEYPECTMAETMIQIAEFDDSDSFIGLSSDVLMPTTAVDEIMKDYENSNFKDTVLFVNLPKQGYKKWEFLVKEGYLTDIIVRANNTTFERVLLILNKESLLKVRQYLGKPIVESNLQDDLRQFQTGWILILKVLTLLNIQIAARIIDIPICNINTQSDFKGADLFVKENF